MLPSQSHVIAHAICQAVQAAFLKLGIHAATPENQAEGLDAQAIAAAIVLETPKDPSHGDVACNIALQLAKRAKVQPRVLALAIVEALQANAELVPALVQRIEVAGPGFINMHACAAACGQVLCAVLQAQEKFGHSSTHAGQRVLLEFVSANPTGPLHVGHGRQAALGDALAAVLATQGWQVHREFYYNDAGVQIHTLAVSVQARAKGLQPGDAAWPESAYNGDYIADIAADYMAGAVVGAADVEPVQGAGKVDDLDSIRAFAVAYLRAEQDQDLQAFGVAFDEFYLESGLYTEGKVEDAVARMVASGHTYEEGGALWLRTTLYGDDKDRVMRKTDGGYTYFVPDVAYHIHKFKRGFARVVNIQGSDHHGTIARVRAGLQACGLGIPQGFPDYILHKMVTVMRQGQEVKISKRAGSYVTLRDLIYWSGGVDETQALEDQAQALVQGRDAVRFFLVSRKADTEFTFDVDLALAQTDENPVYYVQYAHARICSVLWQALGSGLLQAKNQYAEGAAPALVAEALEAEGLLALGVDTVALDAASLGELLHAPTERALVRVLACYPQVLSKCAQEHAPHHLAFFLRELAGAFHTFYNAERVLVDNAALRNARLVLLHAVRQVLRNGLAVLGVSAPERM